MKYTKLFVVTLLVFLTLLCGCDIALLSSVEEVKEFTRGTITDAVYTSTYSQLNFSAPSTWVYSSDEEIAELMDITAAQLSESVKFNEEVLEKATIYDMIVRNPLTGSNIIIMYENLAVQFGGIRYTENQYLESAKQMLSQTQNYVYSDIYEQSVSGQKYKVLRAELADMGITQYFYVRKIDKYILGIVVSVFEGDDIDTILECFS